MPPLALPLSSVLVKPAGPDCNMACGYCFYLEKASLFGPAATHRMVPAVLEALVRQVMEGGERAVSFVWQGGEPTLMGPAFFRRATALQQRFGRGQLVGNALQTNGLLIDGEWTDLLAEFHFLVGLSLDGPEEVHDHYRRRAGGQGTWTRALASLERLHRGGVEVNAVGVVSDRSAREPEAIYRFYRDLGLRHMQLIPCLERDPQSPRRLAPYCPSPEAFGEFLCRLFDVWQADFEEGMPTTSIRFFDAVVHACAGEPPPECTLLPRCGVYVVVEHTGDVYSCDFYVDAEHRLGNVLTGSLAGMLRSRRQAAFGDEKALLPPDCLACTWLTLCRGGCTRHRTVLGDPAGQNPFCEAYRRFFAHAERPMRALARRWVARRGPSSPPPPAPPRGGRNDPCPCGSGKKLKLCCAR